MMSGIEEQAERDLRLVKGQKGSNDPMAAARTIRSQYDGLVYWQDQFWRYSAGMYVQASETDMRSAIWHYLEGNNGQLKRSKVLDVLDAMRAVSNLETRRQPPLYLSTDESLAASAIPLANGILDAHNRTLTPATPDLFALSALPVNYDDTATCPEWLEFLHQLWPDDPSSIQMLQEWFGYLVSGDTSFQKVLILIGPKRAGKGTILRIMSRIMGRTNVAAPTLASLSQQFGLQPLIAKTCALVSDARLSNRADQDAIAERILSISGEDAVDVPRKFGQDYTGPLPIRFTLASNELPRLKDVSGALASRFLPLVLSRSWYDHEDRSLSSKLERELPGIFRWSLDGYQRLIGRGAFCPPASSAEIVQELEDLGSPIGAFVREECVVQPGAEVFCAELYGVWKDWCSDHGRRHPGTEQSFGRDLRAAEPSVSTARKQIGGRRARVYVGIRMPTADDHAV